MRLTALDCLIKELGLTRCAEEFSALVDLAQHTSDPALLVENPIYEAMLRDRINGASTINNQQATIVSLDATTTQGGG